MTRPLFFYGEADEHPPSSQSKSACGTNFSTSVDRPTGNQYKIHSSRTLPPPWSPSGGAHLTPNELISNFRTSGYLPRRRITFPHWTRRRRFRRSFSAERRRGGNGSRRNISLPIKFCFFIWMDVLKLGLRCNQRWGGGGGSEGKSWFVSKGKLDWHGALFGKSFSFHWVWFWVASRDKDNLMRFEFGQNRLTLMRDRPVGFRIFLWWRSGKLFPKFYLKLLLLGDENFADRSGFHPLVRENQSCRTWI